MTLRMNVRRILIAVAGALLSCFSASAQPAPSTQPTTRPAIVPAEDMLSKMLKPTANGGAQPLKPLPDLPHLDQTTGKTVAPAAPVMNLRREGDYISDRTGRLTKGADGQSMELTFDADARAMQDPPMVIVPNLKLMQMENAVSGSSRDLRFRVTGMITEYKSRNYILLEKVSVVPDSIDQFSK